MNRKTFAPAAHPFYAMWEEKVTELHKIVNEDDAEQIVSEVKAEANLYPTSVAIERMQTIIQILLKGIPAENLLPLIRNHREHYMLMALEAGFTVCLREEQP